MTRRDTRRLSGLGLLAMFVSLAMPSPRALAQQERMVRQIPPAPVGTGIPAGPSAPATLPTNFVQQATALLPLAPASAGTQRPTTARTGERPAERAVARRPSTLPSMMTMLASLVLVIGLFLGAAYVLRRSLPAGAALLPREVVEVLGRTPLAGRQQAHLLRIGNKLLLVHVTPAGAETLTEVSDPVEVDRLAGLCRAAQPQSSTDTFQRILQQFAREKPAPGFFGTLPAARTAAPSTVVTTQAEDDDDV